MKNSINGEWLEPKVGDDLSDADGRHFKKDPAVNVISKEEFEDRVEKVFYLLWKTLAKSFGPYGAPTLIYNYPYSHVTKDGYTIMKNLSMDASETKVDQCIADMAGDICGRLNYSVGDGTTSAIIATNSIYKSYRNIREDLNNKLILPRDVIHKFDIIKEEVIGKLRGKVRQIRTQDREQLRKNIYDVVYISSNGDETITNYISDLYAELGAPAISCILAPDGVTKKKLIDGYKYDLILNDRLYINSDDNTMELTNADVIIFTTKVTKSTYERIIKPLNDNSRVRGRHLIVAAPVYDEIALQQVISVDLNNEYRKNHECNMVLTTFRAISAHTKKLVNDFAILMGTTLIDRSLEQRILDEIDSGININQIFNIDSREIPGLKCVARNKADGNFIVYNKDEDVLPEEEYETFIEMFPPVENSIDLGFVKSCSLGLKDSLFRDMIYDKKQYDAIVADAKADLEEKEKKYQKLGTFNVDVSLAQERLYALNLRMGIIEVGADTELAQKLLKDSVDDAIKAASSAFNHGVILGCNVSLIQSIIDSLNDGIGEFTSELDYTLRKILLNGFKDVYKTVLSNAFDDSELVAPGDDGLVEHVKMFFDGKGINSDELFDDDKTLYNAVSRSSNTIGVIGVTPDDSSSVKHAWIHDVIVEYSLLASKVLDISKFRFTQDVINSCQTDEEILKATIDLMSLLITGNQMVITMKHNFE